MARLVIFGAGDIARLADYYFTHDSDHEVVAFTVDSPYRRSADFLGRPLVDFETLASAYPPGEYEMFVALGYAQMNRVREAKYCAAKALGYTLASYVSSRCTYLGDGPPGDNSLVLEDNTIQPFVRIGSNVTLWSGNHIGHDAVIDDHNFVSSHVVISGHVKVGRSCFLGVNSTVRNGVTIAPYTLVGAGATITKDTEERGVYVPHRATKLDKSSDELAP